MNAGSGHPCSSMATLRVDVAQASPPVAPQHRAIAAALVAIAVARRRRSLHRLPRQRANPRTMPTSRPTSRPLRRKYTGSLPRCSFTTTKPCMPAIRSCASMPKNSTHAWPPPTADLRRSGQLAAARAALMSLDAEEKLAARMSAPHRRPSGQRVAQSERASTDRQRFDRLVGTVQCRHTMPQRVRAAAISAEQDVARAEALLNVSRQQASVTAAKRATLEARLQESRSDSSRARMLRSTLRSRTNGTR